ncbi:hypothetical protein M3P36_07380 [Altererythrobacter sp. KTW20L]|uniref:hypothetical protein n=1 Tax=Altererythrobacter sp. KTW20L TaxID=2942210 RepID=UPI0020BD8D99|nr:hypothetical protein [Altererythrobacter sp. KTW20L]MCL6250860.1 hypothetical protein [Altererythrobacter sp. KTW20L]
MHLKTASLAGSLALTTLLAACSTVVENRVETGLVEAGLPVSLASCMAEIWADDLSVDQIRGIQRFANAVREEDERLTVGRLIGHVGDWNDPRALAVVTSSAARCAVR